MSSAQLVPGFYDCRVTTVGIALEAAPSCWVLPNEARRRLDHVGPGTRNTDITYRYLSQLSTINNPEARRESHIPLQLQGERVALERQAWKLFVWFMLLARVTDAHASSSTKPAHDKILELGSEGRPAFYKQS